MARNVPQLTRRLWRLIKVIWRKEKVPEEWQKAEGIFTPKEKDSKDISQFRTISLLNVEGKIFFSVLSKRLTNFLLKNNYVDTSVQKGGVPGFSGCIEHTSAISQLLREARVNRSYLTVVCRPLIEWLVCRVILLSSCIFSSLYFCCLFFRLL